LEWAKEVAIQTQIQKRGQKGQIVGGEKDQKTVNLSLGKCGSREYEKKKINSYLNPKSIRTLQKHNPKTKNLLSGGFW